MRPCPTISGEIRPEQRILINGAGGGVGSFAVQIAKLYGAEVTGVDSTGKLDMMRALGFDQVIDYTQADFTKTGETYDLILDVKTNRSVFAYARVLKPRGIYVTVGGSITRIIQALVLGPWFRISGKKTIRIVALKANKDLCLHQGGREGGRSKYVVISAEEGNTAPPLLSKIIR